MKHGKQRKQSVVDEPNAIRLSISLPVELYHEVELMAQRDSRSLAWVVRKAVENHVKQELPIFNQTPL
jgi:predicted DNA-binding protein